MAPLAFAYGIKTGLAFEVSLLLNLESVATTIIAWIFFHEYVGKRVWLSKVFIVIGAILLTLDFKNGIVFSLSSMWVLGTCIFWGIDNNVTRDLGELSPLALACIKGLGAGLFNTSFALVLGQGSATIEAVGVSLLIGALSYGLSLVLFINALRAIGSARTTTYFAMGPFFGMLIAMIFFSEMPNAWQWVSSILMLLGICLLIREQHGHLHTHEEIEHRHRHHHDDHHQHEHEGTEGSEPHTHMHLHWPIIHAHMHWPDIHHRHLH